MKKIILIFSVLFIAVIMSCDDKEDDSVTVATCSDGIQNGSETGVDCGGGCNSCDGLEWTLIATDVAGDAANSGLDATRLSYQYDQILDQVRFRVEVTNLSIFSDSPSADFSSDPSTSQLRSVQSRRDALAMARNERIKQSATAATNKDSGDH